MCLSRKKAPSQVAQAETPRPLSRSSESSPSQRAVAPVATITDRAWYSSSSTQTRNGRSREVDARHVVGDELRAEALGLAAELGHHLRPHDPVGVARVVLDVARDHQLAAPAEALDHERLQVRARRVEGCGVTGRASADHDQITYVAHVGSSLERLVCCIKRFRPD